MVSTPTQPHSSFNELIESVPSSSLNDPPNLSTMNIDDTPTNSVKNSFLHTLLSSIPISYNLHQSHSISAELDLRDESEIFPEHDNFVPLSSSDKVRLYSPWKYSVIVKVFGLKVGPQLLKQKIYAQWKPTENVPLIDLGSEFYLLKF